MRHVLPCCNIIEYKLSPASAAAASHCACAQRVEQGVYLLSFSAGDQPRPHLSAQLTGSTAAHADGFPSATRLHASNQRQGWRSASPEPVPMNVRTGQRKDRWQHGGRAERADVVGAAAGAHRQGAVEGVGDAGTGKSAVKGSTPSRFYFTEPLRGRAGVPLGRRSGVPSESVLYM